MFTNRIVAVSLFLLVTCAAQLDAALVTFPGAITSGDAGNLGTLPRSFSLELNYAENQSGSVAFALGSFEFPPSGSDGARSITTFGFITIVNSAGPGGSDEFRFSGFIPGRTLSPANQIVNYNFSFVQPSDTIDNNFVTAANIDKLLIGSATFTWVNNQINANGIVFGNIQNAPEPNTMLALIGLIGAGCGYGYRRRVLKKRSDDETETNELAS